MRNEYAEAIAARATDALAKERADNAVALVALLEQAKKEKRAVEAERDRLRDIVRTVYNTIELQATFDDEGGFHLDNVPACVIAEALFRDDAAALAEE